jgi:hypothetical protein
MLSTFVRKLVRSHDQTPLPNRRESRRMAPEHPAPCVLTLEGGDKVSARIHNLSLRGAGVLVDRAFPPGTEMHLLLINDGHTYALTLPFVVARCHPIRSGSFILGGRFARPLRLEELTPLLL